MDEQLNKTTQYHSSSEGSNSNKIMMWTESNVDEIGVKQIDNPK